MSAINCRRPTIQAYAGLLRQSQRSAFLGSTALAASLFGSFLAATPASAECTGAANGSQINGVRNCTGTHPSVEHEVAGGDLVLRLLLAEITTGGMELTSPEGRNITVVPFVGVSSFTSITDEGLLLESNGGNLEISPALTGSLMLDGFTDGLAAVTNGAGTISLTLNGTVTGQTQRGVFTSADAGNTSITTTAAVSGGSEGIRAVTGSGNVSITTEDTVTGDAGIAVFSDTGAVAIDGAGAITADAGQGIFVSSQTGPVRIGGSGDIDASACATIDTTLCNAIQVELSGPADVLINRSGELRAGFDGISVRQNVPGGGLIEITGTGPILAEHRGITVLASGADVVITPGDTVEGGLSLAAPSPGGIGAETTGAGTVTITTSHLVSGGTSYGIAAVVENGNADITTDAVVQGSQGGIAASSTGAGSLFIDGTGNVSATAGPAILARQEALATGSIEIGGSGDAISSGGPNSLGIRAEILNAASSGTILVTRSGTITGQDGGILARSLGDGDITVRDVGPVAGNAGIGIEATGNGGDILVEPDFAVSGSFGIVAATTGPGTATVRFDQDVTATAGDAVTASAENGLASIQQNGGIVLATGDGLVGRSSGTGGVDIELNAGQIGTSADRVRNGILGTSTGLAANVAIDAAGGTSLFASEKGIAATIAPMSAGDILVTSAAAIDASGTALTDAGIYAGNGGNGAIGITLAGGSIVAAGDGILAISQSTNAGGGTGGDITVDATGVPIGTVGSPVGRTGIAAQAQGTFGDIFVTGGQIVATGDGIGVAITNAAGTGTVRVDTGGAIASLTGNGITASTEATAAGSTVTVNVAHDIDAGAAGVRAAGVNGLVSVDQTTGTITAGGNGIEATASGNGSVLVNAERVLAGAAGVVSTATGDGDVTINTEDRIEGATGPGIFGQVENGDLAIATDVDGGGDGNVRGSTDGIFGGATGTGTITVTANDRVTGETESGIQTLAVTGPTSITTFGNVRGQRTASSPRRLGPAMSRSRPTIGRPASRMLASA